jgi:hypothetical protein
VPVTGSKLWRMAYRCNKKKQAAQFWRIPHCLPEISARDARRGQETACR